MRILSNRTGLSLTVSIMSAGWALTAIALPDPQDPIVPLYERPSKTATTPPPAGTFPELKPVDSSPAPSAPTETAAKASAPLSAVAPQPVVPGVEAGSAAAQPEPAAIVNQVEPRPDVTTPFKRKRRAPTPQRALPTAGVKLLPLNIRQSVDGYLPVSFEDLASFAIADLPEADKPTPGSVARIPVEMRELDGRVVCLDGFMLATRMEKGLVKEFLLLRNQMMCCYGMSPALNEWVIVKMNGQGVAVTQDIPIKLYGKLHVGEIYEGNMLFGIYAIDGEKLLVD